MGFCINSMYIDEE
ncbi:hypothetical protein CEXT_159981, partial [Caerostris extrusa]